MISGVQQLSVDGRMQKHYVKVERTSYSHTGKGRSRKHAPPQNVAMVIIAIINFLRTIKNVRIFLIQYFLSLSTFI